ncbi:15461_t:CDS:2, partial [Gigaspora rosea]
SLNIEHQFETTNNLKEIDNEIEMSGKNLYTSICDSKITTKDSSGSISYVLIQEENWPEIQQNFDLNCGCKNGDSTPFNNDQFTSLTNNSEDSVIEPPRLFINGKNQSTSDDGFTVEDTINDLVTSRLKPQDLPIICICLNENNQYISADNRRLYCYQQAIQKCANFKKVLVRIVRETNE